MYNKSTNLVLKDLPPRAEELSPSEIQNVFGGCGNEGASCSTGKECCETLGCNAFLECYKSKPHGMMYV